MPWHFKFVREPGPAKAGGLSVAQQYGGRVYARDAMVGEYLVDLPVEDVVLGEPKTVKALDDVHVP